MKKKKERKKQLKRLSKKVSHLRCSYSHLKTWVINHYYIRKRPLAAYVVLSRLRQRVSTRRTCRWTPNTVIPIFKWEKALTSHFWEGTSTPHSYRECHLLIMLDYWLLVVFILIRRQWYGVEVCSYIWILHNNTTCFIIDFDQSYQS